MSKIGLVILAAGNSSRLGRAKQLLDWKGQSLLAHSLGQSSGLELSQRLVVYGARSVEIEPHLKQLEVPTAFNPDWSSGMGSSIRSGLQAILELQADLEAILFCLADQPLIGKHHFQSMLNVRQVHPGFIISASYKSTLGVPVIFPKVFFPALMALNEQAGAKKIIKKYRDQVIPFPCPEAAFDIDTEADYAHLLSLQ